MRWQVAAPWSLPGTIDFDADTASVTWDAALVIKSGDRVVAKFRKGHWGAFWEFGSVHRPEQVDAKGEPEKPPPAPYKGPLSPREKPYIP